MQEDPLLLRNLKALSIIGMWPPKDSKFTSIYNVYSKVVFIWFCCFTTSQFIEMYYVYDDFKELTSNAGVSLLYAVAIYKVYIALFKKEKIIELVNTIRQTEHKILQMRNNKLKEIMRDYIYQNWGISKKFSLLTFWTIMGFFVRPAIESILIEPQEILLPNGTATGNFKHPLVFSSWFPFDKYDDQYYYVAYGLQTISGTIGASYVCIWDTFIVALMIFAIGQFRVLQCLLREIYPTYDFNKMIIEEDIDEESYMTDEIIVYKRFVECIKHHNMILKYVEQHIKITECIMVINFRYVKDLDELIRPVMFLEFGVCSLMLCAIGLQAILVNNLPTIID